MVLIQERRPPARPPRTAGSIIARSSFVRYALAGLGSFAADFYLYVILTSLAGIDPLIANLFSRPTGGLTCFILNRTWTFRARGPIQGQFIRFWCVFGASFVLNEGLLALSIRGIGIPKDPAKLVSEGLVFVFNYLALKHWTFGRSTEGGTGPS